MKRMKPQDLSISSSPGSEEPIHVHHSDLHASKGNFKMTTDEAKSHFGTGEDSSRRPSLSLHHRKKMVEKWMNFPFDRNGRRNHFSRPHEPKDTSNQSSSPAVNLPPIPADPRKWTAQQVLYWLDFVASRHGIKVDPSDFRMNGRALCLMTRDGFLRRIPEKGTILYDDFRGRVRRYMSACRRRVRTTLSTGAMPMPLHLPHHPLSSIPSATQLHMVPQMYASHLPMAPSAMCAAPPTIPTIPTIPPTVHSVPSTAHAVPSAHTSAVHKTPSTTHSATSTGHTAPSTTTATRTAPPTVHGVPPTIHPPPSTLHSTPPQPLMPLAPYKFVPLYRTMKVFGYFQPLMHGMHDVRMPGVIPPPPGPPSVAAGPSPSRRVPTSAPRPTSPPIQRQIKSEPVEAS